MFLNGTFVTNVVECSLGVIRKCQSDLIRVIYIIKIFRIKMFVNPSNAFVSEF